MACILWRLLHCFSDQKLSLTDDWSFPKFILLLLHRGVSHVNSESIIGKSLSASYLSQIPAALIPDWLLRTLVKCPFTRWWNLLVHASGASSWVLQWPLSLPASCCVESSNYARRRYFPLRAFQTTLCPAAVLPVTIYSSVCASARSMCLFYAGCSSHLPSCQMDSSCC